MRILILIFALILFGSADAKIVRMRSVDAASAEVLALKEPKSLAEILDGKPVTTRKFKKYIAQYRKFGITGIYNKDGAFEINTRESLNLTGLDTEMASLNQIRFYNWGANQWLNNNYIRSVRIYIDAYLAGVVKDENLDKYRDKLKGKIAVVNIGRFDGGGAYITLVWLDSPRIIGHVWVYSFVQDCCPISGYHVRGFDIEESEKDLFVKDELIRSVNETPYAKLW